MIDDALCLSLVRKSERAIQSARLSLQNADPDNAVNRAYYAMFNISRAALLESGVPEGDLPRTHRGINEAFRQHAVLTGRIESDMASSLSKAENLRLMADYTATEIDPDKAASIVEDAEKYVRTVERVFDLGRAQSYSSAKGNSGETLEETRGRAANEWAKQRSPKGIAQTLEEVRSKARENWLRLRQRQAEHPLSKSADKTIDKHRTPDRGSGMDVGRGFDDDSDQ